MYVTRRREPFYELARPYINEKSQVLDIGAGDGSFAVHFKRDDFFLIDGNETTVNCYKHKFPNYYYCKLPQLSFGDNMFDVIHSSHVLEHLEIQDFYDSIKEMDRCLKENGVLIISIPLLSDFFYDDLSHVRPYNPAIFLKYLTNYNYNNLTREKISQQYKIERLQYRYETRKLLEFPEGPEYMRFTLLNKIFVLLKKIRLMRYVKTGYTLIIKKNKV